MKLLVVGATGSIGGLVVEEALRRGILSAHWFATHPKLGSLLMKLRR